eukprot:1182126-Prorocentrum_minimum.AAC.1
MLSPGQYDTDIRHSTCPSDALASDALARSARHGHRWREGRGHEPADLINSVREGGIYRLTRTYDARKKLKGELNPLESERWLDKVLTVNSTVSGSSPLAKQHQRHACVTG